MKKLFFLATFLIFNLLNLSLYGAESNETGTLSILVFQNGDLKPNFEVVLDGKRKLLSDDSGSIFEDLKSGEHFIEIKKGEGVESVSFLIVENERTEIFLNTFADQETSKEVNQPDPILKNNNKLTTLKGKVTDSNGNPIAKARLFFKGSDVVGTTNDKGHYDVRVPSGNTVLSVIHPEYQTKTLPSVKLKEEIENLQNVALSPSALSLDDFVVVAPHISGSLAALIEVRRQSRQVSDVMGSEQMSKSGGGSAASSLTRVTGLTLVDGKYVYIRGLGERYSDVLLNNSMLPSPDPTRRAVQLDLFPSGILESMVVQKSYSPNLPGNFGGGTVILKTKSIPEKFTAKVSIGTAYEQGANRVRTYAGGKNDRFGMDDGTRALPISIVRATEGGRRLFESSGVNNGGLSRDELKQLSKDMNRNYTVRNKTNSLPPSISVSIGDLVKYKGKKLGYLFSAMYSNRWENETRSRTNYLSDRTLDNESILNFSENIVNLSAMFNTGLDLGKAFKVESNTMLLRKTTDRTTETLQSSENDLDANYRSFDFLFQERELLTQLVKGTHQLGSNKERVLSWRGSYSQATRSMPDARHYEQDLRNGEFVTAIAGKRNEKLYNELKDRATDVNIDLKLPVVDSPIFSFNTRIGGGHMLKKRDSRSQRFNYGDIDPAVVQSVTGDSQVLQRPLDQICTNAVIDADACILRDSTAPNDTFTARQSISSYYVDTETKLSSWIRLNAGVRYEISEQSIQTFEGVDLNNVETKLTMRDILPVVGTTFFLTDTLQLRFAYSETVSRPDFKDLNPDQYFDDEKGRIINGNMNLKGTVIKNQDARLEWYFGNGENLSIGYFSKEFTNPIEEVSGRLNEDGELVFAESSFQLANVGNATSSGFEFEVRKKLGFLHRYLDGVTLSTNYSLIDSELNIFEGLASQVTNRVRPLQGQSPYVFNVSLDYDNKDKKRSVTFLYNIFGRRIDAVGTKPFADVYEEPFQRFDIVASQGFGKNTVRFKIANLINPKALLTEDGLVRESYRKGRVFSASYSRSF